MLRMFLMCMLALAWLIAGCDAHAPDHEEVGEAEQALKERWECDAQRWDGTGPAPTVRFDLVDPFIDPPDPEAQALGVWLDLTPPVVVKPDTIDCEFGVMHLPPPLPSGNVFVPGFQLPLPMPGPIGSGLDMGLAQTSTDGAKYWKCAGKKLGTILAYARCGVVLEGESTEGDAKLACIQLWGIAGVLIAPPVWENTTCWEATLVNVPDDEDTQPIP